MKCKRCQGLCVAEAVEENGRYINAARCLSCGSIVFQTLFENRNGTKKPRQKKLGAGNKSATPGHRKTRPIKKICA